MDDKELREKIENLIDGAKVEYKYGNPPEIYAGIPCDKYGELVDQILALLPPKIEELIKLIEWLRDEELVAEDDWDIHCKAKFEALKGEYEK